MALVKEGWQSVATTVEKRVLWLDWVVNEIVET
jgi:hypothetical protein